MKTKLEIRLKCGVILPAGLDCKIEKSEKGNWVCIIPHSSRPEKHYSVRISAAFRTPSMNALEKWAEDGVCKAISGATVEMDGVCDKGTPSWMLAMGLI